MMLRVFKKTLRPLACLGILLEIAGVVRLAASMARG